jgi:hypothetical protein
MDHCRGGDEWVTEFASAAEMKLAEIVAGLRPNRGSRRYAGPRSEPGTHSLATGFTNSMPDFPTGDGRIQHERRRDLASPQLNGSILAAEDFDDYVGIGENRLRFPSLPNRLPRGRWRT